MSVGPHRSPRPSGTLKRTKRDAPKVKSSLNGLDPDTSGGSLRLRRLVSTMTTLKEVQEMRKEIQDRPPPKTEVGATARKALMAALDSRQQQLADREAKPLPEKPPDQDARAREQQSGAEQRPGVEQRPDPRVRQQGPDVRAREQPPDALAQQPVVEEQSEGRVPLLKAELEEIEQEVRRDEATLRLRLTTRRLAEAEATLRALDTDPPRDEATLEAARRRRAFLLRKNRLDTEALQREEEKLQQAVSARKRLEAEARLRELAAELQGPQAGRDDAKRKELEKDRKQLEGEPQKWKLEEEWVGEAERIPPWEELRAFAEALPKRLAGEKPHSMFTHLLQRLSDAQNGERPPVQVRRRRADGTITYEPVTEANYVAVMEAARAYRLGGLGANEQAAMQRLTDAWKPRNVSRTDVDNMVDAWSQQLRTSGFPKGQPTDSMMGTYAVALREACENILAWVEPGVLELVGRPDIVIHGPDDRWEAGTDGYYEFKTKEIHLRSAEFSPAMIQHEFGHHIEDQGPVETWCGFASYLGRVAQGRELMNQTDVILKKHSDEPIYSWRPADGSMPKLPRDIYGLVYYPYGITELLPIALESEVPADPAEKVKWGSYQESELDPEYMALVLPAIRPDEASKAGVTLWTLLSDRPG